MNNTNLKYAGHVIHIEKKCSKPQSQIKFHCANKIKILLPIQKYIDNDVNVWNIYIYIHTHMVTCWKLHKHDSLHTVMFTSLYVCKLALI